MGRPASSTLRARLVVLVALSLLVVFARADAQVPAEKTLLAGKSMVPLELNLLPLAEVDLNERSYTGLIGFFFLIVGLIGGAAIGYRHRAAEVNRLRLKIQILKRFRDE
jgi:hypothetical protein